MQDTTVIYLLRERPREVLLGHKLRGFGEGRLTGIGGKVERGEAPLIAALRELREEIKVWVRPKDARPMGRIVFRFPARPEWNHTMHVFVASAWQGDPQPGAEVTPVWLPVEALPFDEMWDDARHWLPYVLDGQPVNAYCEYGPDNASVALFEDAW